MGEFYKYLVGGGEADLRLDKLVVLDDFEGDRRSFNCVMRACCPPKSGIISPNWGSVAGIDPACLVSRHGMGGEVLMGGVSATFEIVFEVVQARLGKDSDLVRQLSYYRLHGRLPNVGKID